MKIRKILLSSLLGGAVALALACGIASAEEEKVLNVYNWVDYIGETTVADFEKETGIKVVYDTYDASETVDAKLMAGTSGYDVLIHAGSFIPRLIEAGIFQEIDKSKLPNYGNLDPEVLKVLENWDPGNRYGVPYMWGTTGITVNMAMIEERMKDAPLDSAAMIFDPDVISKLADCGVTLLDSPADVIPMALAYLGLDPNSTNPDDYDKVGEMMAKVRPYIRTFDSSNYLNALPNGEVCVVNNWSGDYATATTRAQEAGIEIDLRYEIPKEGSGAWFDVWVIPVDAPHPENAYKWLEFMLRPEVIAEATNYTYYANANKAATPLVSEDITSDPAIYPPPELLAKMFTPKVLPSKIERIRTRLWSTIKTGE
jgi:putrescine transport system substrate-binding protein